MLLTLLTLLSALSISAVAIFYSIAGLAAIFAGAAIPIMIMGTVLEVGKLVTASWLYQNWKKSPFFLKFYLTIAVVVLMFITSMGIFGFLSKAATKCTPRWVNTEVVGVSSTFVESNDRARARRRRKCSFLARPIETNLRATDGLTRWRICPRLRSSSTPDDILFPM